MPDPQGQHHDDGAALERHWDALLRGEATDDGEAAGIDPELTEAIAWVREVDDAPAPDPRFLDRLEERLVRASPSSGRVVPAPRLDPNGRIPSARALWRRETPAPASRGRWLLSQFGTALLLVVTVGAVYVAFRGGGTRDGGTGNVPAAVGTPPVLPPGVTVEPLIDATVADLPPAPASVSLERWTVQPGSAEYAAEGFTGPLLITVESGRYVYRADGPTRLSRADAAPAGRFEEVPPGAEVTLRPGDQLVVPAGTVYRKWNGGDEPTVALVVAIIATNDQGEATWDAALISGVDLIRTVADGDRSLPTGPARVTLERWTLAPGTALPAAATTGVEFIRIEAGTLGLTYEGDRLPYLATPGIERTFTGLRSIPAHISGTVRAVRNAGTEPLVLLVLTIGPVAAEAATPT